ncbi:MAG TPA: glycosyltransferase family 4 protein [Pyrinomonadaceae bacterium]
MRILHISSARNFGGGEKHLVDLTRELTARGHEIFVALRPTNEWQKKLDFLPAENILHVSIRNSFGVFSAQKIASFVREKNIEIIHAHLGRDYIPASLVCRMTQNTKFVLTRHVLFPMKSFHRFALRNLSKAIAVSPAVTSNLQKIFPAEKIECVPNGINTEDFERESEKMREEFRFLHNIAFDATVIGIIGELKVLKGQRDFVLAAQTLAPKFPEAFFVVVGKDNSTTQEFRRELKKLVKIFNLEDRFLWLNWVEDTAPLLAAIDVFVSASHTESFGLATLEAMAGAKAIVSTETEGARSLIKNGTTGKLVPIKEPLKLAEAVEEFLQDADLRKALGQNARKAAKENFDLKRMIEETERVYRKL